MTALRFLVVTLCVALVLYLVAAAVGLPGKSAAVVFVFVGIVVAVVLEFIFSRAKPNTPDPPKGKTP